MTMVEIVRRMNFASLFDTSIWQSYFADMSRQGLHLQSIGAFMTRFQRGEPKEYQYRMVFLSQAPDRERQEFYHQNGWEYVCWQRTFCVLRADVTAAELELAGDPTEQILHLSKMEKQQRINGSVAMALVILSLLLQLSPLFYDSSFRYFYLDFNPFLLLITLCVPVSLIYTWLPVRRYKLGLTEGPSAKVDMDWRRVRRRSGTALALYLVVAMSAMASSYVSLSRVVKYGPIEAYYLPDHPDTIAMSLDSIEGRDDLRRSYHWIEGRELDNYRTIRSSFLVPQQAFYKTTLTTSPVNDSYDTDHYDPQLRADHYTMLLPFTATHLAQELCAERSWWPRLSLAPVDDSRFDALYVMNEDHPNGSVLRQYPIAAALGRHVLVANYIGEAEMSRVIDEMARVLVALQ